MRTKEMMVIFLVVVILTLASVNSERQIKLNEDVEKALEKNDRVNVVVKVKDPGVKSNNLNSLSDKKILREYGDLRVLSVTKSELKDMENDNSIESIGINHDIRASLIYSVPLINATVSWLLQSSNVNLTGIGQTVCIIDTGINFTHPDLIGKNKTCVIDCYNKACIENCSKNDDNGHGTHVAGIIAANRSLRGVAPDASLIGLKVLNSAGSGSVSSELDLKNAIDWCVANRINYNISVISMSLGTSGLYMDYCDSDFVGTWTDAINNATSYNISVVVSSGNDGNVTAISSPACIQNASAIGDTYDADFGSVGWSGGCTDSTTSADKIVCHSNRNALVKLFAPGALINSSCISADSATGYCVKGGTSMAAPHVAGAIALIRQYLSLANKTKTPSQIENALNNTGKNIDDSAVSGRNFSRINVYNAIISLDTDSPNITLISPANGASSISNNQTFKCNSTDLALKNMTFYLWNSTGVYNSSFNNFSGGYNNFEINITNIPYGNYTWNCIYYDENNNLAYNSNYTLSLSGINVNLTSPPDNFFVRENQTFNCSVSSSNELANMTFYLWNSSSLEYNLASNISGTSNSSLFGFNFTHEGSYSWNCLGYNNLSNSSFASSNFSLVYDLTAPNITLISPENPYSTTGAQTIGFEFNVTDNFNISSCSLIVDNLVSESNSSVINVSSSNILSHNLEVGSYSWQINCTDKSGNNGNSSARSITITSPPVTSNSGGGGGGGGGGGAVTTTQTYVITNEQINNGHTQTLSVNSSVKFGLISNNSLSSHNITLKSVSSERALIVIRSNPIEVLLNPGEERKLSLDSLDRYDLYIKLNSVSSGKANITIKQIDEPIILRENNKTINLSSKTISNNNKILEGNKFNYYSLLIIVVVFIILLYVIIRMNGRTKHKPVHKKRIKK